MRQAGTMTLEAEAEPGGAVALLRQLAALFKLRIGVAIALSALAGAAMASGPALAPGQLALLALATLLASAASGAFNQYAERDLDAAMARTRRRPFVTGRYRAGPAWVAAILLLLALACLLAWTIFNGAVALYLFLGAFVYGVVYTVWLKTRTWLNIVIGGLSGSFAVLAGAAAVEPSISPAPAILALVIFLWTPPHFWSLATAMRKDYEGAGVPMLPVVIGAPGAAWAILAHAIVLSLLSLLPVFFGLGWIYLIGAGLGGLLFVRRSLQLVARPDDRAAAMANFRASLLQLSLLLAGTLADRWLEASW
jgi:protoheme IX farnesyltransferase